LRVACNSHGPQCSAAALGRCVVGGRNSSRSGRVRREPRGRALVRPPAGIKPAQLGFWGRFPAPSFQSLATAMGTSTKRWLWGELSFRRVLRLIVEVYAILCFLVLLLANRVIFQPPDGTLAQDDAHVEMIHAADGARIATRFERNDEADFALLVSHGNAEDLA